MKYGIESEVEYRGEVYEFDEIFWKGFILGNKLNCFIGFLG